jgi:hypothetical protein
MVWPTVADKVEGPETYNRAERIGPENTEMKKAVCRFACILKM